VEVFLGPWGDDEAKFTEAARKLDAVREGLSRKTPAELGAQIEEQLRTIKARSGHLDRNLERFGVCTRCADERVPPL
jgi:hypothetical protein